MSFENLPKIERHEPKNSEVTESLYVPQHNHKSCGVAAILMARNLLTGVTYPHSVKETFEIMKQNGYPDEAQGLTSSQDRKILVNQLNEFQDIRLVHKVLDMPSGSEDYIDQLEKVLGEGAVVMLGFKKPYFELPNGTEVTTNPGISHGALIHGIKKGQNGETKFVVTDPESEIAQYFGRNIEVSPEKLMDSLSDNSKTEIEVIFTAV